MDDEGFGANTIRRHERFAVSISDPCMEVFVGAERVFAVLLTVLKVDALEDP